MQRTSSASWLWLCLLACSACGASPASESANSAAAAPAASGTPGTPAATAAGGGTTASIGKPPAGESAQPTAAGSGPALNAQPSASAGSMAAGSAASSTGSAAGSVAGGSHAGAPASADAGREAVATAGQGAAGQGAAGDAASATGTPGWQTREDLGKGDGKDVVTIGDSWMDYIGGGGGIQAGLDRAGTKYRHYALSATTLLSGQIPGQYTQAKRADPKILTVLMTGGGNDIMFSGGCNTAEACEESVKKLVEAFDKLWTQMADDGVKDVVLIQYSADAGTAPKGTRPKMIEEASICKTGRIFCHYLATTDLVMGQLVDGIHPTAGANDRIAKALLQMMEQRKMRR